MIESQNKKILTIALIMATGPLFWDVEAQDSLSLLQLKEKVTQLEENSRLKISGYIQAQFQYGEKDASLRVGGKNENGEESYSRIGLRRGRIKFSYTQGVTSATFQLDMTEKGVGLKDAYLSIKDNVWGTNSLKAGVFDRPFGHEISYSSSRREAPERSTIYQTLFPEERDLGAMITLQPSKTSPWNFLKLEAGIFAGNGIKQETDSRKDFIGHLSASSTSGSNIAYGLGISYYNGRVFQPTENVFTIKGITFESNSDAKNKGSYAVREYFGVDGQLMVISGMGMTQLKGEYLWGTQPGDKTSGKSPNSSTLPTNDTYIRQFRGGYVMLVQDMGTLPLSAVLKYDWYDPNTDLSGNDIGKTNAGTTEMASNTLGMGLLWRASNNIRVQLYYDIVGNEISENMAGYQKDLSDNVFTLRLQYKF